MRKVRLLVASVILAATLGVVGAPVAQSHGLCIAKAFKPSHPSGGGNMTYSGEYNCGTTLHDSITLTLSLQRRPVGGSWVTVDTHSDTDSPSMRNFTGVFSTIAFDCRKDYRTHTVGDATPGGHHNTANSSILTHTC
jgi:hypothetical protein